MAAPTERVRVTVSIDPEVLEVFKSMSASSGVSVSRCLGDWLADTADGARFVASKMQEARRAPVTVMREMQAAVHGTKGEVDAVLEGIRAASRSARTAQPAAPSGGAPSSNTGLKSPRVVPGGPGPVPKKGRSKGGSA